MTTGPTVLYLHGNGGTKLEILNLIKFSNEFNINLCSFDFSGCGNSEGEYLTYGQKQIDDIETIVQFLQDFFGIRTISLWGRSMGASLAVMYAAKTRSSLIDCLVLDTPFRSLDKVLLNVARQSQKSMPDIILKLFLFFVKSKVQAITNTDIFSVDFKSFMPNLQKLQIPILFACSGRDTVVTKDDTLEMYDAFHGNKEILEFNSMHPDDRPREFLIASLNFIRNNTKAMSSLSTSRMSQTSRSYVYISRLSSRY